MFQEIDTVGQRIEVDEGVQRRSEATHRIERARQKQHREDHEVHHAREILERVDARGQEEPQRPQRQTREHDRREGEQQSRAARPQPHQREQNGSHRDGLRRAEQGRAERLTQRDRAAADGRDEHHAQYPRIAVGDGGERGEQ